MQHALANDIHELATRHQEGITQLLEKFDNQQIETTLKLDTYEKEWCQQEGEEGEIDEESGHTEPVDNDKVSGHTEPVNHNEHQGNDQSRRRNAMRRKKK